MDRVAASAVEAGIQKVTVSGGSVSALPAAPGQPVQFGGTVPLTKLAVTDTKAVYTVPAGKRLVIEFVSVDFTQQFSDDFAQLGFDTGGVTFYIPVSNETGRGQGYDFDFVGGEQVKVYANAGQTVTADVRHGSLVAPPAGASFAFSGYLVDAK
jgi:hypothetical protein